MAEYDFVTKINPDIVATNWQQQEVVFKAKTKKGLDWIRRHWHSDDFQTYSLLNAAEYVKQMNGDGLQVVLFCGV